MTAKHSASPTSYRAFSHSLGHEDPFPPRWLNVRCVIRHGTFAETNGNGRDAPEADIDLGSADLRRRVRT
jgi:hypothetical protein